MPTHTVALSYCSCPGYCKNYTVTGELLEVVPLNWHRERSRYSHCVHKCCIHATIFKSPFDWQYLIGQFFFLPLTLFNILILTVCEIKLSGIYVANLCMLQKLYKIRNRREYKCNDHCEPWI